MSQKRRCKGTITNDKRGREGQPCKLWARPGSDFCNRHNAPDGGGGPRNADALEHRCIARSNRTGSQCKNPALRGQRTCRFHGATKASTEKAQDLIDRMVEPVLWELRDIALKPETSESDRLRAIQMVLDRALPKERKVEVSMKPWEVTMQHIFQEAPTSVGILRGISGDVIDADVVDEDEEDPLERHEREEAEKRAAQRDSLRDQNRDELINLERERERVFARPISDNVRSTVDPIRRR